jgi:CheY-like chemotaxis protein
MNTERSPVLMVEDDPNDVVLVRRAFRKANLPHPLHAVEDGDAAIAYLGGEGVHANRETSPVPRLILLDLKLPRKSGLEVLEWIKSQARLRRIPVVVLTSSRQPSDVNRAYDLGVNSYLVKPVSFDRLLAMVTTIDAYWLGLNEHAEVPER